MDAARWDGVISMVTAFLVFINTALIAYGNAERTRQNRKINDGLADAVERMSGQHKDAADRAVRP